MKTPSEKDVEIIISELPVKTLTLSLSILVAFVSFLYTSFLTFTGNNLSPFELVGAVIINFLISGIFIFFLSVIVTYPISILANTLLKSFPIAIKCKQREI